MVFLLLALPVDALKFPKVQMIESSTFTITGGETNSSVIKSRDFCQSSEIFIDEADLSTFPFSIEDV